MKASTVFALMTGAGLMFGAVQAAHAAGGADLAKTKNCMSCHAVDKKMVGPAYKDVAAKYKGKGAEAALANKIIKGGVGAWGQVPMPPNSVTEAEAKELVKWVMSQ